jgi:hypothetical protein
MNLTVSMQELVPAQEVKDGPIFENIFDGDKVDIFNFPAPKFYELDGGRYIGTMATMVLRDPETDNINIGVYRMGILDSKTAGVQILKGKRGDKILKKYQKAGKKMPACAIIGGDPLLLLSAAAMMTQTNGYDVVSTLRDQTMEIVRVPLTGLPVPATAEIVLEGEIDPDNLREEGPSVNIRVIIPMRFTILLPNLPSKSTAFTTGITRFSGKQVEEGLFQICKCLFPAYAAQWYGPIWSEWIYRESNPFMFCLNLPGSSGRLFHYSKCIQVIQNRQEQQLWQAMQLRTVLKGLLLLMMI